MRSQNKVEDKVVKASQQDESLENRVQMTVNDLSPGDQLDKTENKSGGGGGASTSALRIILDVHSNGQQQLPCKQSKAVSAEGGRREAETSPNGEIYQKRTSVIISSSQPISAHHTNQPCPEPSLSAQAKKANT